MVSRSQLDVEAWVRGFVGSDIPAAARHDLFGGLGIEGDDGDEFLMLFAEEFSVDLSGVICYFHYDGNEPPGVLPPKRAFDVNGRMVHYLPISMKKLADAATTGILTFDYPKHTARAAIARSGLGLWLAVFSVLTLAAVAMVDAI